MKYFGIAALIALSGFFGSGCNSCADINGSQIGNNCPTEEEVAPEDDADA